MEDARVGHSDERTPECLVGEPLWQFAGREPLDEILLDREVQPKGVAFDEHQSRQPETMVEGKGETQ